MTRHERPALTGVYPRPVPLVGDRTTSAERRDAPTGWAFDADAVEAIDRVICARRDIRRFRPDDVADTEVRALLAAAHAAPSVGHSQPWRFVVVRDPEVRSRAAMLADRNRLAQAAQLDPESARQLLSLQLDGLREAPVGIVVGCDRRAPAAGVLGRATMHDADVWSCACAIENLWLAARARGIGVGWVTLFSPSELTALVGFPDGVVPLGWLCIGYPDERPPAPGLERRGWSARLDVDDVVAHDEWNRPDCAPPVSRLVTGATPVTIVRDRRDDHLTPPDGLGLLDQQLDRIERILSGADNTSGGGTLLVAIGDHPVADLGVTAFARSVTSDIARATAAGESVGARAAAVCRLGFTWFDAGAATGDLVDCDALREADVDRLVTEGRDAGRRLASDGVVALGEAGIGNTTVAAALGVALAGLSPEDAVGLGAGSDSTIVATKRTVVERAVRRVGRRDTMGLVAGLGGPEIAYLAGVVLGVTDAGGVVILDGMVTAMATVISARLAPSVVDHLVAGQRSSERAHAAVLGDLGLEPLLDWRLRAGEGLGSAFATRALLDGLALRALAPRTSPREIVAG